MTESVAMLERGDVQSELVTGEVLDLDHIEEAMTLVRELRARAAAPAISALRERAESIRTAHLDRALARLQHLPERDRRVVESLSESLAHALIHEPTVRLRESPEREASARDLFSL